MQWRVSTREVATEPNANITEQKKKEDKDFFKEEKWTKLRNIERNITDDVQAPKIIDLVICVTLHVHDFND